MLAQRIDRGLVRFLNLVSRIEISALVLLMIFIIVSIALQTLTRYAWGRPITWVEEAAVYAFIWITFLGASYGARQGRLIKVEILSHGFGEKGLRKMLILSQVVTAAGCAYLAYVTPAVMAIEARSSTISLPIDVPRSWFYSVPLFYFAVATAVTCLARLYRLLVLADSAPLTEPFPLEELDSPHPAS